MEIVSIPCPQCGHQLRLRDRDLLGQSARCPECDHKFLLEERDETRRPDNTLSGRETIAPGELAESLAEPAAGGEPVLKDFGRYQLLRELGEGAMGTVYLARDVQLGRQVALKIPKFCDGDSSELLERFYREARSAATLRHPNICPVYDVGEVDGAHYLTMAYIEGRTLSSYISSKSKNSVQQVVGILRKLASALEHAHQRGIVHRDLKPGNIMIDKRNDPIVMDFGLALQLEMRNDRLTQTGTILGTPAYMPPEQVRGEWDKVGPPSDIYSLGVILYELLTGDIPFDGPVGVVMAQVLTQEPPKPSEFRPDLDPRLEAICLQMMAKEIDDRYASMHEVDAALAGFLESPKGATKSPRTDTSRADTTEPKPVVETEGPLRIEPSGRNSSGRPTVKHPLTNWPAEKKTPQTIPATLPEATLGHSRLWIIGAAVILLTAVTGTVWMVTSSDSDNSPDDNTVAIAQTDQSSSPSNVVKIARSPRNPTETSKVRPSDALDSIAMKNPVPARIDSQLEPPGVVSATGDLLQEPSWLTVTDLIATAGRAAFPVELRPAKAANPTNRPAIANTSATAEMRASFQPHVYVSIRGVVPVESQLDAIRDSMADTSRLKPNDLLQYVDFELERQVQSGTDSSLSAPWVRVNTQPALEMLKIVKAWVSETYSEGTTDAVLTMPLPQRVFGTWAQDGFHPRLPQLSLSKQETDNRNVLAEESVKHYQRIASSLPQPRVGGFASLQYDLFGVGRQMLNASDGETIIRQAAVKLGKTSNQLRGDVEAVWVGKRNVPMLFRCFDFAVQAGTTYRYRVRLITRNPNFGQPAQQAVAPTVVEGTIRSSPWSNPTSPLRVPALAVSRLRSVRNRRSQNVATFDVIQWLPNFGTSAEVSVTVEPGQFVGGHSRASVLDAKKTAIIDQEVDVATNQMLLSIRDSNSEHRRTTPSYRELRRLQFAPLAVVVDEAGQPVFTDLVSSQDEFDTAKQTHDELRKPFLDSRGRPARGSSSVEAAFGGAGKLSTGAGRNREKNAYRKLQITRPNE